jgi:hypothetical protein
LIGDSFGNILDRQIPAVPADSEDITPGKQVKITAASLVNLPHQARKRPDRNPGTGLITSLRHELG